jgi:hypothetical protein
MDFAKGNPARRGKRRLQDGASDQKISGPQGRAAQPRLFVVHKKKGGLQQ